MTLHAYQEYEAAEIEYRRVRRMQPGVFDWAYLLAAVQMAQGEFDAAAESFRASLRIRPDALPAELHLAECFAALARWDDAAVIYRHLLNTHPELAQAWYGMGRVQAAKGDHSAAAASYAKACELFPSYGAAQFALTSELRRAHRKEEADVHAAEYGRNSTAEPPLEDQLFERISELNHSAQAHLQHAAELERAGRLMDAIGEERNALAVDPDNVQAHVNLISLYGRTGDNASAKSHFEAVMRRNRGRSDAWLNHGLVLLHEGDTAAAEAAFRQALAINPAYAEAHYQLGLVAEARGALEDAAGQFREAVAAQPAFPAARFHLGRILVHDEKYDEAIDQFKRALVPQDENTTAYLYALAATCARAGLRKEAFAYFERARAAAVAHGQTRLLESIERDMKTLGAER